MPTNLRPTQYKIEIILSLLMEVLGRSYLMTYLVEEKVIAH